jgi:hypothetical protein
MAKTTLTLNPNNDQLVPIEALAKFSEAYLQEKSEGANQTLIDKTKDLFKDKEKAKKINELHNVINNLKGKGGRVWFQKVFLMPFGGSKDKLAQEVFDTLSKANAFDGLEQATAEYNQQIRPAIIKTANAAKVLTDVISNDITGLSVLIGKFSTAFMAGPGKTAPAAPANESNKTKISKEMFQAKKLLELGLITKSEYIAELVKTRKLLNETADAAAAAAPTAPAVDAKNVEIIKAAITTIMGSTSGTDGALSVLLTASAEIQQGLTDYSNKVVVESKTETQLSKAYIKKKILENYNETKGGEEKPYLNEFLFTLITAALAALAGWVAGKLKGHYNGGATGVVASHPTPAIDKNATADLIKTIERGLNANGQAVDATGAPVSSLQEALVKYQRNLVGPSGNIRTAYGEITAAMAAIGASDPNMTAVLTTFNALEPFKASPLEETQALIDQLQDLSKLA